MNSGIEKTFVKFEKIDKSYDAHQDFVPIHYPLHYIFHLILAQVLQQKYTKTKNYYLFFLG